MTNRCMGYHFEMGIQLTENDVPKAARLLHTWLAESKYTVAFTGAGISTESGIPDFRSPGGVWAKNRTVYFDEFCQSADARFEYWRQKSEAHRDFLAASPNITHQTLSAWEAAGKLKGVITQNIDGLHSEAGSKKVLELHGTAREVACLDCEWRDNTDPWVQKFLDEERVPDCPGCGGRLKHATVSFGQSLPADAIQRATIWSRECELFLAMGSSLVVEPAAGLPRTCQQNGGRLVILNRDETPLDHMADLVVYAPLGKLFAELRSLED